MHLTPVQPAVTPLEGERRIATVILADVRSSTDLMEKVGTENWVQLMNRVLQTLAAEIYRFGGQVDQFRGDGLVAFFGTTQAHEDDPQRAVLAALAMQAAIKSNAEELAAQTGFELKLRVGVNTGEVIVAHLGDPHQHREDTAMGEAVTIAARMEMAAEPGTVMVSANTYRLIENTFEWQPLGEISVKGIARPMAVYRPLSSRAVDREGQAHRLPLTIIGRENEFQRLKGCIEDLCDQRGGIALLIGETGMGKSLLIDRTQEHFAQQEVVCPEKARDGLPSGPLSAAFTWLATDCHSYDQSTPFSMWLGLLRDWIGTPRGDTNSTDASAEDMAERLSTQADLLWGKQADKHFPYLAMMLSLPVNPTDAERIKYLNAEGLHRQLSHTLCEWVEALARLKPLILVINDLHWVDATSLDQLQRCLGVCDSLPVLWLASFRPDRNSAVWEFRHHVETEYPHRLTAIDLAPLSEQASRQQIEQIIGSSVLSEATTTLVIQKAEGNPYYIQEILYALIHQGVLEQDPQGSWRQVRAAASLNLPESLQRLILARIDQLKPADRHILQMAAIIGPMFWIKVLEVMVDDPDRLQASLIHLQRAQLIQEHHQVTDLGMEYSFTPSLVRDVAYESLLQAQRIACHLQVAEQIEKIVRPDYYQPYYSMLAYHYRQAGRLKQELYHVLGAAETARKVYANADALGHYTRAIELLDELEKITREKEQRRSIQALRFEALNGRREVQYHIGALRAGQVDAQALLPLAQEMADDPVFMVDALLAQPLVTDPKSRQDLAAGQALGQQALDLARQVGDQRREMQALVTLSNISFMLKDPTWQEQGEKALALTRQLGDLKMEVNLLLDIGNAYGMDNLQRSIEYLEAALAICQGLDDRATENSLMAAISPKFERSGDYYRQLIDYERKRVDLNRELGNRLGEGHALMFCGQIQTIYLGDYDGGLEVLQQALKLWEDIPDRLFILLRIAQVDVALLKFEEARGLLEQAQILSESVILDIGHAGLWLVSAILYNAWGDSRLKESQSDLREQAGELFHKVFEETERVKEMVSDDQLSRQYLMSAMCESAAAHLGLAQCAGDEQDRQAHLTQALECSQSALDLYEHFGFTQIVECVAEEILYRHSLALGALGHLPESDEYLKHAYDEMMRKHDMIPRGQPQGRKPFRTTFDEIQLHRKIRLAYDKKHPSE